MKAVLLVALAGCTSLTGHPPAADAPAETLQECQAAFDPSLVQTCATAADCVLLAHDDCCGVTMIGVTASDQATAMSAEATYDACAANACGARGCASQTVSTDGKVAMTGQTFVPTCIAGVCGSTVQ
jgi:hypothetical protein